MSETPLTGTLRWLLGPGDRKSPAKSASASSTSTLTPWCSARSLTSWCSAWQRTFGGCPARAEEHDSLTALVTAVEL
jgi:hypothetical protein